MTASGNAGNLKFFSPSDGIEMESMVGRIIPADETPGAAEAGGLYFIDRALTTFDQAKQPLYNQGLRMLQAKTREIFPNATKFSALAPAEQTEVLTAIEKTEFFTLVRQHTIIGFLADPVHGGNRDRIGWKLIGFEGEFAYQSPYGDYDRPL